MEIKKIVGLLCCFVFILPVFGQGEPIKGTIGLSTHRDLRIRADMGLIEEGRLKKFDFNNTGLKNIAVLYWPDNKFEVQKIGITLFENQEHMEVVDTSLLNQNRAFLATRLEALQSTKFVLIASPDSINLLFKRKPIVCKVSLLEAGPAYLATLRELGYDGLFIIYEDGYSDLISGSKVLLSSKGLFKYYKKELVYYGLYSTLIDLRTMETVKNIGYKQLSAEYSPLDFNTLFPLDTSKREIIKHLLAERFVNNIEQMIGIHKMN